MLAIILTLATTGDITPSCDIAELNYVYRWERNGDGDSEGDWQTVLVQWVFWDWSDRHKCYVVRQWSLARSGAMPTRVGGRWVMVFRCSRSGRLITVHPRSVVVTHTDHDPELENRDILQQDRRRPLVTGK